MNRITPAASVLVYRSGPATEFLHVRRNPHLRFLPGFWAFPGGKYHPEDDELQPHFPAPATPAPDYELLVTGIRELFEETGILLVRDKHGAFPHQHPDWIKVRDRLLQNDSFGAFLSQHNWHIDAGDFRFVGELTTPEFTHVRFRTRFFLAEVPPHQEAHLLPGELDDLCWATAANMLERWTQGELLLSPPTVEFLQAIDGNPIPDLPTLIRRRFQPHEEGRFIPIPFAPLVKMIPLRTHGLPPSTHTNAFLFGHDPAYLFDPGTEDLDEQHRLFDLLDTCMQNGMRLKAVVVTHHHRDHIGAVSACADRYKVPVWAHPRTAELLVDKLAVTGFLNEGDVLPLGQSPMGTGPWQLHVLHTPGHASGHLAFWEPTYRLLFVADMVSTLSSVVIVPPDGDLQTYLHSLERLQTFPMRLLLPCHGSPSSRPEQTLQECLRHRVKREQQLLDTLTAIPQSIETLLPILYKGTPTAVLGLAAKQLEAGLLKLANEGKVERTDSGWRKG